MPEGRLVFTCLKAVNLKSAQTFGKQDPYLDVKVGRINYRGKTITDGGTSPVFNQKFEYDITNETEIVVTVYNSNSVNSDDHLGDVVFPLTHVFGNEHHYQETNGAVVTKSGKTKGDLSVIIRFTPAGGAAAGSASAPAAAPAPTNPQMTEINAAWAKHEAGRGGIDKNGLHSILNELGFFQGLDTAKQMQVVHGQFEAADTSKDGWIDFNEFAVMYNRLLDSLRQHPKAQAYVPQNAQFITPPNVTMPPPAPAGYAQPTSYQAAPSAPGGYSQAPGGYPPAQGGYPPAQGGYPPAQGGYPPAPGAYPAQPQYNMPTQQQYNMPPQQQQQQYNVHPVTYVGQQPHYPQQQQQQMYYGAPMAYGAGGGYSGGYSGGGKKYKGKKYKKHKRTGGGGFGFGGMALAFGGGMLGGALLDDIFD